MNFHLHLHLRRIATAVALPTVLAVCSIAQAQVVYRCGNTYTRVPCSNGRALDVGDPRTAAQRAEARRVTAEERRQAAAMERDRRRSEAASPPAVAGRIGPAANADTAGKAASAPHRRSPRKPAIARGAAGERDFVAEIPGTRKAQKPRP